MSFTAGHMPSARGAAACVASACTQSVTPYSSWAASGAYVAGDFFGRNEAYTERAPGKMFEEKDMSGFEKSLLTV